jgi:rhodanese-related sulfurtransferase
MDRYIEFVKTNPILFIMLGIIIGLILWSELRRFTRGFKEVSPLEAVQLINHEAALLLDIREDPELNQGRIAGARHIPLSVLKQRMQELDTFRDRPVITFCRSGTRSTQASDLLLKSQFHKVFHMKGGLIAWENADLPKIKK